MNHKNKAIASLTFMKTRTKLCPCVPGWGIADDASLRVARLAVESKLFPLFEVEDGLRYTITHKSAGLPVREYLMAQSRFRHLTDEAVRQIQEEVDQQWARLVERARTHAVPEAAPH
jgi:pyruvate/2-oxoacid:ferredoxin oxidoreductase beta subunit